jgi:peptide/nickel transport system permease protein
MRTYLLKRLLLVPITLFGISVITFLLIHMAPGDPASIKRHGLSEGGKAAVESQRGTVDAITKFRERYGLHLPLHEQYLLWLKRLVVDRDLGETFNGGRRVWDEIKGRIVITASLEAAAFLLIFLVAIPTGIWSAWKPGSPSDRLLSLGMFVLYSLPAFWVATMLILLFGNREQPFLGISFPVAGLRDDRLVDASAWETVKDVAIHAFLPVVCLSYGSLAAVSRYMRTGMLEVIRQDYVRTARAKGLPESRVILKHALRNGLFPIVTLAAAMLPAIVAGSIIVESIFSIPGMGQYTIEAIRQREYHVLMVVFLFTGVMELMAILVADVTYAVLDPRVTFDGAAQ